MYKRKSVDFGPDFGNELCVQAKRVASATCVATCQRTGSGQVASPNPVPATCNLTGDVDVWLAVAAQVQNALSALPGWIQVTQPVQTDSRELLSSRSSASTPFLAPPQPAIHSQRQAESLPRSHHTVSRSCSGVLPSDATSAEPSWGATGAPMAPGAPPSSHAVEMPAPAQPHPVPAAAPTSCASDTDSAASYGWFCKCRGCCQLTAGEMELQGEVVPLCRGCSCSLLRRPPVEREHAVQRILRAHEKLREREAGGPA